MNQFDSSNPPPGALIRWQRPPLARGKLFLSDAGGQRRANDPRSTNRLNRPNRLDAERQTDSRDPYRLAFSLLYLFTLLLYIRPNDLLPGLGSFPLAKIVAILAPLAYIHARYSLGKPIINWTIEIQMVCTMLCLAILFTPVAASAADSVNTLSDSFIKMVIILILMIGVINTRVRLRAIISLTVLCGTWLAIFAIKNYATGNLTMKGDRIEGVVGGMFGNPNDLAAALCMLIPLAVTLAVMSAGSARLFHIACALVMTGGVIVTFSRGGFLTLIALAGVMMWKFGRGEREKIVLAAVIVFAALITATPENYRSRFISIFDHSQDKTGSAQQRSELFKHGVNLAIHNPIVGIGMGNFHIYSIREKVAHNAYVETAAELGLFGLIAYLVLILAPLRGLARIEREAKTANTPADLDSRNLSIGLQAVIVAYMVASFFLSIQYLWYLYYAAGYAAALRQIHAAEKSGEKSGEKFGEKFGEKSVWANGRAAATADQYQPIGKLWKSAPRKPAGNLWPAYRFRKGF
ncbi:MAG: O-antigen ligase family protein [Blastocatellales bacterium]